MDKRELSPKRAFETMLNKLVITSKMPKKTELNLYMNFEEGGCPACSHRLERFDSSSTDSDSDSEKVERKVVVKEKKKVPVLKSLDFSDIGLYFDPTKLNDPLTSSEELSESESLKKRLKKKKNLKKDRKEETRKEVQRDKLTNKTSQRTPEYIICPHEVVESPPRDNPRKLKKEKKEKEKNQKSFKAPKNQPQQDPLYENLADLKRGL